MCIIIEHMNDNNKLLNINTFIDYWMDQLSNNEQYKDLPTDDIDRIQTNSKHFLNMFIQSNETLSKVVAPFITFDEQLRSTPKHENVKVYEDLKSLYSSITMRVRGLDGKDPFELKQGFKS